MPKLRFGCYFQRVQRLSTQRANSEDCSDLSKEPPVSGMMNVWTSMKTRKLLAFCAL